MPGPLAARWAQDFSLCVPAQAGRKECTRSAKLVAQPSLEPRAIVDPGPRPGMGSSGFDLGMPHVSSLLPEKRMFGAMPTPSRASAPGPDLHDLARMMTSDA